MLLERPGAASTQGQLSEAGAAWRAGRVIDKESRISWEVGRVNEPEKPLLIVSFVDLSAEIDDSLEFTSTQPPDRAALLCDKGPLKGVLTVALSPRAGPRARHRDWPLKSVPDGAVQGKMLSLNLPSLKLRGVGDADQEETG